MKIIHNYFPRFLRQSVYHLLQKIPISSLGEERIHLDMKKHCASGGLVATEVIYIKQLGDRIISTWDRFESFLIGLYPSGDFLVVYPATYNSGHQQMALEGGP